MKFGVVLSFLLIVSASFARTGPESQIVPKPKTLPVSLSDDFQFRKVKLFELSVADPLAVKRRSVSNNTIYSNGQAAPDSSLAFERSYHLFGAVTDLDRRQRYGHYMDFFWRTKRPAPVTLRLEYRQQALRELVLTREVSYPEAKKGTHKTEFTIVGDEYMDGGPIIAWRCSVISDGRIVAQTRSYMWE